MQEITPQEVVTDLDNGFLLTGDSGYQRYIDQGNGKFLFKTGYEHYHVSVDDSSIHLGVTDALVEFDKLSHEQIETAVSPYYGSVQELKDYCGDDLDSYKFLVCECFYELTFES